MACYHPLDAYRLAGGSVKIGYEPEGSTEKLSIPCGTCFGCRMEYAQLWSIRAQHEAKLYDRNLFVTLTYDDDHLPWHRGLELDHLQRFMKRLRKAFNGHLPLAERSGDAPIRYFAAGEYGGQTDRPHWHLLLFNLQLPDYDGRARAHSLESLSKLWPYGGHEVDQFTPGRAAYVAGYASKKVAGRIARRLKYEVMNPETGEVVERRPEFSTKSMRPGLGIWYFNRYRSDFKNGYIPLPGGQKLRLPRLYRQYLSEDAEWAYRDEDRRETYLMDADASERLPARLEARETVAKAKKSLFTMERGL